MEFICPADATLCPLASIVFYYAQKATKIKQTKKGEECILKDGETEVKGEKEIALYLCKNLNLPIYPEEGRDEIDAFVEDYPNANVGLLNNYLTFRTFLVGETFTVADIAIWAAAKNIPEALYRVNRWASTIAKEPNVKRFLSSTKNAGSAGGAKKAEKPKEKVCTRFAPEPSGYLHIGHAKAALASEAYTRQRGGEFILRFDNTNPKNESAEFEEIIKKDLELLNIKFDRVEHTSDYIPMIIDYLVKCLKEGLAYIDDTPFEEISKQRLALQPSVHRDDTVEQNLAAWEEMQKRTEHGLKCVVRAKIDYKSKNGVFRDPVIARHIENGYHPKTGTKYPVFPVYDFACPIVDSHAGVTHAMRSWEYTDRDQLYYWFLEKLHLRPVKIISFSRLSFTHTVLGKRYLRALVKAGKASGWDDPRFPTVRGLRRRGLLPETLKEYCQAQGASATQNLHEWDKLWALNKARIQPKSARVMSVSLEGQVPMTINGVEEGEIETVVNPKNAALGSKKLAIAPHVLIEQEDAQQLEEGKKFCFFHWNTAIVDKIEKDGDKVKSVVAHYVGDSDFKSTQKINWIVPEKASKIIMREWNYLIEDKEYNSETDITEAICKTPFADTEMYVDQYFDTLKKGDIFQLDRRADCIVDSVDGEKVVFLIPTGSSKPLGLSIKIQLFNSEENKEE